MTTTPTPPKTLTLERTFHASPELVWEQWTRPEAYARWFAPAPEEDLTIHEWDAREGGRIRFDMPHGDGKSHEETGVFHELVPHRRIVSGAPDRSFLLTATFEPVGKATRVRVEVQGVPSEWHAMATEGWGRGFDKLERALALRAGGFRIERTFKAAPEKVWRMWTTPEGLMKWWALSAADMGFVFSVRHMDVRPGGTFAFNMKNKDHDLVNRGTYTRVRPEDELAWTWHFDIYLAKDEPAYEVPISITFRKTPENGTRMTFVQGPLATPASTKGSHDGVAANVAHLAKALGE